MEFLKKIKFFDMYIFFYFKREGIKFLIIKDVYDVIKKERFKNVVAFNFVIKFSILKFMLNKELEVIFEYKNENE